MVEINEKNVRIFSDDKPNYVLIHPTGKHELDNISSVFDKIRSENDKRFCLASFEVEKWNAELSPWCAPQAFGNEPFGDGPIIVYGQEYVDYCKRVNRCIPWFRKPE